jgi:hypothetical protein
MNKDLSACTGVIKGGAKSCPQKLNCKRFAVHSDKDKNPRQSYIEVPYLAIVNKSCTFKL